MMQSIMSIHMLHRSNADLFFFQQVKRRVEEREAEQVAAMMNMVPPWQESWPEPVSKTDRKTHSRLWFLRVHPFDEHDGM